MRIKWPWGKRRNEPFIERRTYYLGDPIPEELASCWSGETLSSYAHPGAEICVGLSDNWQLRYSIRRKKYLLPSFSGPVSAFREYLASWR